MGEAQDHCTICGIYLIVVDTPWFEYVRTALFTQPSGAPCKAWHSSTDLLCEECDNALRALLLARRKERHHDHRLSRRIL